MVAPPIFSRASKSTIAINPHIFGPQVIAGATPPERPRQRADMNETEASYALVLEAMLHRSEISRYEYEGVTLRWADMKYTPDFLVFECELQGGVFATKMIEVKGAKIWDRDIVRFKGARAYWPEFAFEMHQRKKGAWSRLY